MNANAHSSIDSRDELASAIIHGLGALATLAAGSVLITLVSIYGDRWQLVTSIVFSTTLFLLYVASTLYHAIPHPGAKARLRVFDHCAIYLLIAGTYTPFTLITLRGPWGWGLFATIWTLALSGVVFKLFFTERFRLLSTIVYVVMGWLVVIALGPLQRLLDGWTLRWLLAGRVLYTLGTYFYHRDEVRYFHAIWHVFVACWERLPLHCSHCSGPMTAHDGVLS